MIWAVNSCLARGLMASGEKKLYKEERLQAPPRFPLVSARGPPDSGGTESQRGKRCYINRRA